jgi:hypothetical protein
MNLKFPVAINSQHAMACLCQREVDFSVARRDSLISSNNILARHR